MSTFHRFPTAFGAPLVLAAALGVVLSGTAPAQRPRPDQLPKVNPAGSIEDMAGNLLLVSSAGGDKWTLQITRETKVHITGKADASILSTGQSISFTAEVDKRRGTVEEKVKKLTIFTPSEVRQWGAFPSQGFGGPAVPGEGVPEVGGPNPFGGPAPGGGADAGPPVQAFDIQGRISGIRKGKISVFVPNQFFKPTIEIEVDEEADIDLDVEGNTQLLNVIKKGDKLVESAGVQVAENGARLKEMTIELAEPLSRPDPKKKPTRPTRPTKPDEEPKEGPEAAPEAGGEKVAPAEGEGEKEAPVQEAER